MDKEVPRRAMKGIISVLIKNNEEKTKETAILAEGYIKAVRDIFGEDSIVVDKSRYFNITPWFIIYTYVRLYFTVGYHYFLL